MAKSQPSLDEPAIYYAFDMYLLIPHLSKCMHINFTSRQASNK